MGRKIRVRASATVSNLNCGFDVLGLAINEPYDVVEVELTGTGTAEIAGISGCDSISRDPAKNVVGTVLNAMISKTGTMHGFRAFIEKGIAPGSGIGSSAASSAAAAYAANELLGRVFSMNELVLFAMEGEKLACGSAHADNVAPALLGGITLIRSYEPLDVVPVHVPAELFCVVIHPAMEIMTSVSRGLLDRDIPLKTAVRQWGNVGGLIAGLFTENYDLISRSLEDFVAEPKRAALIPRYSDLKRAALDCGALGAGISGSGPSIFALCRGEATADAVKRGMEKQMSKTGLVFNTYLYPVNRAGAQIC